MAPTKLRTRRQFTDKFKRAAIKRLATASVTKVAQACGVSVSVLHRWRKQLGNHRAIALAGRRRQFSKEFKEAAVRRLEQGETVRDVVHACQLNPTVLRRWWQEWRRYGEAAFSGYGKPRSPSQSSRTVIVRFTQDEYESIQAASRASRASSLPDFVRAQVLSPAPSIVEIVRRMEVLVSSVRRAAHDYL
jgi:transposase-like protein